MVTGVVGYVLARMLWTLLTLSVSPAADVTPFAGLEWRPLSRGDAVWIEDGRTSGTGVGEFDGIARPNLTAFGGAWVSRRIGLAGSLGIARVTSTTWVNETWQQRHWGVVRPAVDLRISLSKRVVRRPAPWILFGAHGDVPSARLTSNGFSETEQDIADQDASAERARLGGFGARAGLGLDYRIQPGISFGLQYAAIWHRGVLKSNQQGIVTSWVAGEASALLTFEWASKSKQDAAVK